MGRKAGPLEARAGRDDDSGGAEMLQHSPWWSACTSSTVIGTTCRSSKRAQRLIARRFWTHLRRVAPAGELVDPPRRPVGKFAGGDQLRPPPSYSVRSIPI